MTDDGALRDDVFEWTGAPLDDTACAICRRLFNDKPGDFTGCQYAAFMYHLNEPDRICELCAFQRRFYIIRDFTDSSPNPGQLN